MCLSWTPFACVLRMGYPQAMKSDIKDILHLFIYLLGRVNRSRVRAYA